MARQANRGSFEIWNEPPTDNNGAIPPEIYAQIVVGSLVFQQPGYRLLKWFLLILTLEFPVQDSGPNRQPSGCQAPSRIHSVPER